MKKESKPYVFAGKRTIAIYLLVNIVGMLIEVYQLSDWSHWRLKFHNGVFFVNDELTGLKWGETHTVIFLFVVFLGFFFYARNKQRAVAAD